MASVSAFTVADLESFSRDLRTIGEGAHDMVEVAQRVCDHLDENLVDEDGTKQCLLVSLHKTHAFKALPPRLQRLARQVDETTTDSTACLTRLGHAGYEEPEPDPGSLVRPLTATAFETSPILVGMLVAMGLDVDSAVDPNRALSVGLHRQELDMFLVPDVMSSEWVPDDETRAQVEQLGLASLLGIGGGLPSGDLFFLFWFTHRPIDERSADLLRSLATAVKASLIPFTLKPFAESAGGPRPD